MLVGIIAVQTVEAVKDKIETYSAKIDVFEWRIDLLSAFDFKAIRAMRVYFKKPLMLTLRSQKEGGQCEDKGSKRLEHLRQLASLLPEYLDLESTEPDEWIMRLHADYPSIHLLRSFHAKDHTPDDLDAVFSDLYHPSCQSYKIIGFAHSALDALRLFKWLHIHSQHHTLTAHCMGERGFFSRVLSPIAGGLFQFVQLGSGISPAPGCLSLEDALDIYHVPELNRASRIYALIGYPVSHSIGHLYHNQAFKEAGLNAIYVKIDVESEQLSDFLKAIQYLPFAGFSVTMPLKERVMLYVEPDEKGRAVGAVNTLCLTSHKIKATNTDGDAFWTVLKAIFPVSQCSVLIIGAGGAARAIARTARYHAVGEMIILNRSKQSAGKLGEETQSVYYDFEQVGQIDFRAIDIVINTLPIRLEELGTLFQIWGFVESAEQILVTLRYDDPSFAGFRSRFKGRTLDGSLMFQEQARAQQVYWQQDGEAN